MFEGLINIYNAFIWGYFLQKYLSLKKYSSITFNVVATVVGTMCISLMNHYFSYEGYIGLIVYIMYLFLLSRIFLMGDWKEQIYYILIINSIHSTESLLVAKVFSLIGDYSVFEIYANEGLYRAFIVVILQTMVTVSLVAVYRIKKKHGVYLNSIEKSIGIIILLLTNILFIVMNYLESYFEHDVVVERIMLMMLILMIAVNIIVHYLLYRIHFVNSKEVRSKELEKELELYKNNTKMLQEKYKEIKKIRHDIHNSYLIIAQLAERNQIEDIKDYVGAKTDELEDRSMIFTGCVYVDALLVSKLISIKKHNIQLEYQLNKIDCTNLDELDVCSILGNLLDNAIESCLKVEKNEKVVQLKIKSDNDKLFIHLNNSTAENVTQETVKGGTSKVEKNNHGMGMEIVEELVARYNGQFRWTVKNQTFNAQVLLFADRR